MVARIAADAEMFVDSRGYTPDRSHAICGSRPQDARGILAVLTD